ncbi:MAG: hypothetical protein M3O22_08900 [Pseudomonadota bacterium]|nr:hypothetical protein [Pseudomonadota bacterium]
MRHILSALAVLVVFLAPAVVRAQDPMPQTSNLNIVPFGDTEYWTLKAVHSRNSNLKLICTMTSKQADGQSITMTWDGKSVMMTVSRRVQPRSVNVTVSSQGQQLASGGATVSSLQVIRDITIPGPDPLSTLRDRNVMDLTVAGENQPLQLVLSGMGPATDRLRECMQ